MPALLAAGRTPACRARDVAKHATHTPDLGPACSWIEAFAAVRPRLRAAPLLGSCLEELTTAAASPVQSVAAGGAPASRRRTPPVGAPAEEGWPADETALPHRPAILPRPSSHTAASHTHNRRAQAAARELSGLPASASHSLLSRLAGEQALSHNRALPGEPQVDRRARAVLAMLSRLHAMGSRQFAGIAEGMADRPADEPHGLGGEPGLRGAWLEALVARAERALHSGGWPAAAPGTRGKTTLAQQWETPIAGQTAPIDLLVRLAEPPRRASASAPGRIRSANLSPLDDQAHEMHGRAGAPEARAPATTGAAPFSAEGRATPAPLEAHGEQQSSLAGWAASQAAQRFVPNPYAEGPETRDLRLGAEPAALAASLQPLASRLYNTGDLDARIAPPAVRLPLPPLVPAQEVGAPELRVAAALARRGALAEAMAAGDDLEMLAAQIKRILDEEARRYGIDV